MSVFVFGYFATLIAGASLAVYYKSNEALGVLCSVTLLSMLFGILWGEVAFWAIAIIAIGLIAAGALGYCFRAYMLMLQPEHA